MKRSSSGEQVWRDMKVSVIMPGQKDIVWKHHAEPKRGYTEANLDVMLDRAVEYLERNFPSIEFRHVELTPNDHKFIYHGKKESMSDLNGCPEVARSPQIAGTVCKRDGHKLSVFQNGMTNTPNGPQMNTINFCSNCGLSLAEVRGDLDARIDAAVRDGVNQKLAAMVAGNKPAPAGAPGIEIVPDVKAKAAAVESSS